MNVNQTPVYNAANLALFMVNVSQVLPQHFRPTCPTFSTNDLKARFRGRKYVSETLMSILFITFMLTFSQSAVLLAQEEPMCEEDGAVVKFSWVAAGPIDYYRLRNDIEPLTAQ